jgi:chondroitin 4-sulfotransferase 11
MNIIKKSIKDILIFLNLEDKRQYFIHWRQLRKFGAKRLPISSNRKRSLFNDYNSNVIFIHIPKAAGMSVVNTLYNRTLSNHATAMDYFKENPNKFRSECSFAITRNPYTRLYSAYYYLKSGGMNIIDKVWRDLYLSKYESFESFIVEGGLENAVSKQADHFIPQYKFIYDDDSKRLCDFVGKIVR